MYGLAKRITMHFAAGRLIDPDLADYCTYALQCQAERVISSTFFILLGVLLQKPFVSIALLFGLLFLRARTGGAHADSFTGCVLTSLAIEWISLQVLLPWIPFPWLALLGALSALFIWAAAPFNHVNLHLNSDEIRANRIGARVRLIIAAIAAGVCFAAGLLAIGETIVLSAVITAVSMAIAYLRK